MCFSILMTQKYFKFEIEISNSSELSGRNTISFVRFFLFFLGAVTARQVCFEIYRPVAWVGHGLYLSLIGAQISAIPAFSVLFEMKSHFSEGNISIILMNLLIRLLDMRKPQEQVKKVTKYH